MYFFPDECFILTDSADPDGMQHYSSVYLGLHCQSNYIFHVNHLLAKYSL